MKGSTLPVNTIVVVAIAVLVLLVIGGFFTLNVGSGIDTIELNGAISNACSVFATTYNCDPTKLGDVTASFRRPGQSQAALVPLGGNNGIPQDSLCGLSGVNNVDQCLAKCGCGGASTTTTQAAIAPAAGSPPATSGPSIDEVRGTA